MKSLYLKLAYPDRKNQNRQTSNTQTAPPEAAVNDVEDADEAGETLLKLSLQMLVKPRDRLFGRYDLVVAMAPA